MNHNLKIKHKKQILPLFKTHHYNKFNNNNNNNNSQLIKKMILQKERLGKYLMKFLRFRKKLAFRNRSQTYIKKKKYKL